MKLTNAVLLSLSLSSPLFAQSIDVNRGIRIDRDQLRVVKPVRAGKVSKVSLGTEQLQSQEKEVMLDLKAAVAYFEKHPKEIENHLSMREYKIMKELIAKGDLEALEKKFGAKKDKESKQMFLGAFAAMKEVGGSYRLENDQENLLQQYQNIYSHLGKDLQAKFAHPKKFVRFQFKRQKAIFAQLLAIAGEINWYVPVDPKPNAYKEDCTDELGVEVGANGDDARRCLDSEFHADGLFHNNDFGLKYYHTCIKSQGARGTCVSFAINAAIESIIQVKQDKAYNFSEQLTYFYGEIYSNHSGRYSYGLNTQNAIKKMDQKDIRFQYEKYWQYNTSLDMEDKSGNTHAKSCWGYSGEMCTNFAFQAQESISGPFWNKQYNYTIPYLGTQKRVEIFDYTNHWNSFSKAGSLHIAKTLLAAKVPLVVSFTVKQNFSDAKDDGYVRYMGGQTSKGGHAAVLLGFVPNSELPAGVHPAREEGYFIMKNSWGTWNGDCGLYYVDFKYLRKFAKGLYSLTLNI